jgi:alpha-glucoside transport system permease protein
VTEVVGAPADSTGEPGTVPAAPTPLRRRISGLSIAFLTPAVLLLLGFLVYPIIFSIVRSLYDKGGGSFIGLKNYQTMFTDGETFKALRNNVIWVVVAPTLVTIFGLFFAILTERIKWATAFKVLIFMPMAISFLASGVIFRLVYDEQPDQGVLNAALVSVHDTFKPGAGYPGARPSVPADLDKDKGGAFTTKTAVQPGSAPVNLGLLAIAPKNLPSSSAQAAEPGTSAAGSVSGTVWLDFKPGGGGTKNAIDPGEKGLPGITVQAVQNGKTVAKAKTSDTGAFTIKGLKPGSYDLKLPGNNFTEPYNGVTWLGSKLITPSIIGAYLWIYAGFAMVLLAAGMSAIPRDALEAARIDGATEWQVFRRVTMPLLAPVLVVVFVTLVINVLKLFDLVYVIAPASVQPDANVLALQMWRVSFGSDPDQGLGSAIAIFLLLLVVPAMILNVRRFKTDQS